MVASRTLLLSFSAVLVLGAIAPGCSCGGTMKNGDGGSHAAADAGDAGDGGGNPFDAGSTPGGCTSNANCAIGQSCAHDGTCLSPNDAGYIDIGGTGRLNPDGGCATYEYADGGCVDLRYGQVNCPAGSPTTISGAVYEPSGRLPLYNAIVYVPDGPISGFPDGVTCDVCSAFTTGNPLVNGLTDPSGHFTLTNVPAGTNIPLVYQIGKWRRQVIIPNVPACQTTTLTDIDQQRLPRSKSEGDLPHLAISTGSADPFECLLNKLYIAPSEFTVPAGSGRVSMYVANGRGTVGKGYQLDGGQPTDDTLWTDAGTLRQYDIVLLPCEGGETTEPDFAMQNLSDYTNSGGRIFTTHYGYSWMAKPFSNSTPTPFNITANWMPDPSQNHNPPDPFNVPPDTTFPKGLAFSQWLQNVSALNGGNLPLHQTRHDVSGIDGGTSQWLWALNPTNSVNSVQHLTFNMPYSPPPLADGGAGVQCGRVVYSDFHVVPTGGAGTFPAVCGSPDAGFTPQEKALVFMLFDVSSCIQSDQQPPIVCATPGKTCATNSDCCNGLLCLNGSSACDPQSPQGCTCVSLQ